MQSISCINTTSCVISATDYNTSPSTPAIFVSTNPGASWSASTLPSSLTSSYSFGSDSLSCDSAGLCIAFATNQSVFPPTYLVLLSSNTGSTFSDISSNFGTNAIFYVYCSDAATSQCIVSSLGWVYLSTNSGSSSTQESIRYSLSSGLKLNLISECDILSDCYYVSTEWHYINRSSNFRFEFRSS